LALYAGLSHSSIHVADRALWIDHRSKVGLNCTHMEHSPEFLKLVDEAKTEIREISVEDTLQRLENGAQLIDVREDGEFENGHARNARHMGRGIIERDIVQTFPDKATELILYCGGGYRSALAAANLQKMGYSNVWSMAGGWKAWKQAGAPTSRDWKR
jgi:rhodanese-related sulfurtransferase